MLAGPGGIRHRIGFLFLCVSEFLFWLSDFMRSSFPSLSGFLFWLSEFMTSSFPSLWLFLPLLFENCKVSCRALLRCLFLDVFFAFTDVLSSAFSTVAYVSYSIFEKNILKGLFAIFSTFSTVAYFSFHLKTTFLRVV